MKNDANMFFGKDANGKTFVFSKNNSAKINKIYIEKNSHFTKGDFISALYKLGQINGIKNSDYQKAVEEIFVATPN